MKYSPPPPFVSNSSYSIYHKGVFQVQLLPIRFFPPTQIQYLKGIDINVSSVNITGASCSLNHSTIHKHLVIILYVGNHMPSRFPFLLCPLPDNPWHFIFPDKTQHQIYTLENAVAYFLFYTFD